MKGILGFLGSINKAWLGGVVAFVATFVVQQFFGVTLETGTTDLITNILWQALVALGVAAPTAVGVYAIPNKQTVPEVAKAAEAQGYGLVDLRAYGGSNSMTVSVMGDTAKDLR